jgi:phosphotransacetylase
MNKPIHILSRTVTTRGVINLSALAAVDASASAVSSNNP